MLSPYLQAMLDNLGAMVVDGNGPAAVDLLEEMSASGLVAEARQLQEALLTEGFRTFAGATL